MAKTPAHRLAVLISLLAISNFPAYILTLELVYAPEHVELIQGDASGSIVCETDEPFEFCKIIHAETGKSE